MSQKQGFNRRDFLKIAGLAGITLPTMNVVGNITGYEYLASREAYGGFVVRRTAEGKRPYQVDDTIYKRFPQRNTTFTRIMWDKKALIQIMKRIMAAAPPEMMEGSGMKPEMMIKMLGEKGLSMMGGSGPRPNTMIAHAHMKKKTPGKTRLDFAFAAAGWTAATTLGTFNEMGMGEAMGTCRPGEAGFYSWKPLGGFADFYYDLHNESLGRWDPSDYTPQEVTDIVKIAAKFYGASLVGVAEVDERWFYSKGFLPSGDDPPIEFADVDEPIEREDHSKVIPRSMKYVISLAFEMDYDGIARNFTGASGASVGMGYSRMAFTAGTLAEFLRALGYHAIPSGNGTGLSVPIAVDAGLGELGRHGVLITPKYGPRVRLCKVITDLPLVPDKPITFGVTEFCEVCGKCAEACPGSAISSGPRTWVGSDISNNPGTHKWYVDGVKCLGTWMEEGVDCGNCITVCPFNKPNSWLHGITRDMIGARSGVIDQALLKLDDASGYGKAPDPQSFWKNKKDFMHIKG